MKKKFLIPKGRPELGQKIGEGSYGAVYNITGFPHMVAKLCSGKPDYVMEYARARECSALVLLSRSDESYFVKLRGTYRYSPNKWALFLDAMDNDLSRQIELTDKNIRHFFFQSANAVLYLHNRNLMHRDIKNCNILVKDRTVKMCDFGSLSYTCGQPRADAPYTHRPMHEFTSGICTLTHRAPELLLDTSYYNESIDVWSMGVVLAEMYLGTHLFWTIVKSNPNEDEEVKHTFHNICKCFGTNDMTKALKNHELFDEFISPIHEKGMGLQAFMQLRRACDSDIGILRRPTHIPDDALDLIGIMLQVDPYKRASMSEVSTHRFFMGRVPTEPVVACPIQRVRLTDISTIHETPYDRKRVTLFIYAIYIQLDLENIHTLFSALQIANTYLTICPDKTDDLTLIGIVALAVNLFETRLIKVVDWNKLLVDASHNDIKRAPMAVEKTLRHDLLHATEWMYVQALQQQIIPKSRKRIRVLLITEAVLMASMLTQQHSQHDQLELSTGALSIGLDNTGIKHKLKTTNVITTHLKQAYTWLLNNNNIISQHYINKIPHHI
jgi:serine/threonine protein kinase